MRLAFTAPPTQAQTPVTITVDAAAAGTPWHPTWNWFGADEPNYLTTPGGRALLTELVHLDPGTPVYFRPHNLLTSGDGTPALKWGSTGVYSEDAAGHAVYNWRITDRLFDAMVHTGITPFVEIGFTPEALSPHPQPYQHSFPHGSVFTGWSYPPNNDAKWSALITAWAAHLRARYGAQVDHWRWEVWNEPDIAYFHGTPEQYFHLYDITAAALRRAIPNALVGGPAVTGPYGKKPFLRQFLDHCAHGVNAATGKTGAPLTFISFHPKGAPKIIDGQAQMGISRQLDAMRNGFRIAAASPEFAHLPIILSESDPEGCAACLNPANTYRTSEAYGTAVLEATARSLELAHDAGVNLEGAVNWSFLFPGQPMFAGFRSLAVTVPGAASGDARENAASSPGIIIDKPVLDTFRLLGELGGQRLPTTFSPAQTETGTQRNLETISAPIPGTTPVATLLTPGAHADTGVLVTRRPHELDIMVWTYSDTLTEAPPTPITLQLSNLPHTALHMKRQLIDRTHSNAFTAWEQMGSPEQPIATQVRTLQSAAKLATVEVRTLPATSSEPRTVTFPLERNAATLVRIAWR